jgi:FkbM family methyltransferase
MQGLKFTISIWTNRLSTWVMLLCKGPFHYRNPIAMFLTGFKKDNQILRLRNGVRMTVRPRTTDRAAVNENFVIRPYTTDVKGYEIRDADTVVDVGANIGAFSIYASRQCRRGRIFSIEPDKDNFAMLQKNVEQNGATNVTAINAALFSEDGEHVFYSDGAKSSLYWNTTGASPETVKTMTFHTFLNQNNLDRIDYLKMDCEGAEFDILFGLDASDLGRIKRIGMEFHNVDEDKNATKLCEYLRQHGFRVDVCRGIWNGLLLTTNES